MKTPFNPLFLAASALCILLGVSHSSLPPADRETLESELQEVIERGIAKYEARGVSAAVVFPTDPRGRV